MDTLSKLPLPELSHTEAQSIWKSLTFSALLTFQTTNILFLMALHLMNGMLMMTNTHVKQVNP